MAVLPLAVLILSMYFFVMTPLENTITRTMEYEADIFGINASQQPHVRGRDCTTVGDRASCGVRDVGAGDHAGHTPGQAVDYYATCL